MFDLEKQLRESQRSHLALLDPPARLGGAVVQVGFVAAHVFHLCLHAVAVGVDAHAATDGDRHAGLLNTLGASPWPSQAVVAEQEIVVRGPEVGEFMRHLFLRQHEVFSDVLDVDVLQERPRLFRIPGLSEAAALEWEFVIPLHRAPPVVADG